jgi:hypothetical protein
MKIYFSLIVGEGYKYSLILSIKETISAIWAKNSELIYLGRNCLMDVLFLCIYTIQM